MSHKVGFCYHCCSIIIIRQTIIRKFLLGFQRGLKSVRILSILLLNCIIRWCLHFGTQIRILKVGFKRCSEAKDFPRNNRRFVSVLEFVLSFRWAKTLCNLFFSSSRISNSFRLVSECIKQVDYELGVDWIIKAEFTGKSVNLAINPKNS